jgi:hypothetical protein
MNTDPATIQGDSQLKKIYDNLSVKIGSNEVWRICTDDGVWWSSGTLPDKTYAYMMVKFHKPDWYSSGKLNWQIKVEGGADVYAWRWYTSSSPHVWAYIDKNNGGSYPPLEQCTIPASYFGASGDLWLLFKAGGSPSWLKCDVVDIHTRSAD